jgi:hypothetical protein
MKEDIMFKLLFGTAVVALMATSLTSVAEAQQVCGKRAEFVTRLDTTYKETTSGVGLINNGMVIEVLTSSKGSWTILMTKTNGVSCVVASGEGWETVPQQMASGPAA